MINDKPIPCPAGNFCAKQSYKDTANSDIIGEQCTVGTFNPWAGARSVGDCINCPEGYHCTTPGLADDYPDLTECAAGYYCPGADITKAALVCPIGAYCE
jgi:hypothetical protein